MKNEIGRKLTSLTIMAIMLGGLGIAQGFTNSYMPVASAQTAETSGMLSVSSTTIQGAAILEIVVNDPDISDTTVDINGGATFDMLGTTYDMVQAVNGKWYAYVVDLSVAGLMDADTTGLEFGYKCTSGLGTGGSATILSSSYTVYAEALATSGNTANQPGGCLDMDNMIGSLDATSGTTSRQTMSSTVLTGAPSCSIYVV